MRIDWWEFSDDVVAFLGLI